MVWKESDLRENWWIVWKESELENFWEMHYKMMICDAYSIYSWSHKESYEFSYKVELLKFEFKSYF